MNKLYLVVPAVLLGGFLAVQIPAERRIAAAADARTAHLLVTRAADEARRATEQERARLSALQRTQEAEAKERLAAEAKQQAHDRLLARLDRDTAAQLAANDTLSLELAALDGQLTALRTQHEATDRAVFDLTKRLELQRIERRQADLEFQRLATMLAQRVADRTGPRPPTPR